MALARVKNYIDKGNAFPPIDAELEDVQPLLSGRVLNVGAGERDISHLISGELVNQDIRWDGDERTHIDIYAPMHEIPGPPEQFDAVVCIAVLEHVINPQECVAEMQRVLKPGGHAIVSVPFMQPEHKVPTDYQRYTRDGLENLLESNGFHVEQTVALFNVYTTLHWMLWEWIAAQTSRVRKMVGMVALVPLTWLANRSHRTPDALASAFRVVAVKPG